KYLLLLKKSTKLKNYSHTHKMGKNGTTKNGVVENAKIAIIGLGYVGLPLAIEFGKKYDVLGFDINSERVKELQAGQDRTQEANLTDMTAAMAKKQESGNIGLSFSSTTDDLRAYNTFIVTVPTPIDQFKAPDLRPLIKASGMLG